MNFLYCMLANKLHRLEHRLERHSKTLKYLEGHRSKLSKYGYFDMGYHVALVNEIQDQIDDIKELLEGINK